MAQRARAILISSNPIRRAIAAGIGRALAKEFLKTGDNVIVSSRSEERVRSTVKELEQLQTGASVAGIAANVSKPNDVAALARFASTQLGTVDLWCAWVLMPR